MLTELCQELRNWFDVDRREGTFTISGGTLTADFLQQGQYYRILGSVFNDGVHMYGVRKQGDTPETLHDETFEGEVWALGIPEAVLSLDKDIDTWVQKYGVDSAAMSPYTSESFGGYSYTKGQSGGTEAGGWKAVFAGSLNRWRKI